MLDPAFTTTRPLPKTIEAEVDPSFAPMCSVPVPERALVKIPGARIRSVAAPQHKEVALVVLPDDAFVGELVALTPGGRRSMLRAEPSYGARLPSNPVQKEGNFCALLGFAVHHYYHGSHDLVMSLRGVAPMLPPDTQIIVPKDIRPFQIETLALLGLDDHPRVPYPAGACWELGQLFVVTPKLKTQIDSPEPFRWFREAAMERYGIGEAAPTRRLYLSRKHDGHWRTTNEPEVERFLGERGFETVAPGTLSFREQIELFGQAEIIVGTGAGLFNLVFAPPGAKVLQFQEARHIVHALWTAASAMGFDYHYVLCDSVSHRGGPSIDIHVPIARLGTALETMGGS